MDIIFLSNMGFNSALLYRLRSLAITEEFKKTKQTNNPEIKPLLSHIYFVVTEVTSR